MNEADRALVERVEHDDLAGGVAQALCRIIRELEAERDRERRQMFDECDLLDGSWRHAGSTIRRLRRRWQWERRRAEGLRFIMQRDPAKLLVLAVAERDAARAEVERWSRHAAKRESERDQYVTTALLANQQRDAARAEASAFAAHVQKLATELLECRAERDALRARCERMEKASRDFYNAWIVCESNRGCYSTAEAHDCRCALPRRGEKCNCGRDELEAASEQVDAALKEASDGR